MRNLTCSVFVVLFVVLFASSATKAETILCGGESATIQIDPAKPVRLRPTKCPRNEGTAARSERAPAEKPVTYDRDHDGIVDAFDACPDMVGVVSADPRLHGCPAPAPTAIPEPQGPADTDGDGIVDAFDACPRSQGPTSESRHLNGCPSPPDKPQVSPPAPTPPPDVSPKPPIVFDADGDGVKDEKDACPEVPGVVNTQAHLNGCPTPVVELPPAPTPPPDVSPKPPIVFDADGDGVKDEKDACPEVKGKPNVAEHLNGCPPPRSAKNPPATQPATQPAPPAPPKISKEGLMKFGLRVGAILSGKNEGLVGGGVTLELGGQKLSTQISGIAGVSDDGAGFAVSVDLGTNVSPRIRLAGGAAIIMHVDPERKLEESVRDRWFGFVGSAEYSAADSFRIGLDLGVGINAYPIEGGRRRDLPAFMAGVHLAVPFRLE